MEEKKSVLVMESEESVVKDIHCSLGLLDIPVTIVEDVTAVKEFLTKEKPALIITRQGVSGDAVAGVTLAEELARDKSFKDVPVVIMLTNNERSVLEKKEALFEGEISLPVEFPTFSDRVKAMLDGSFEEPVQEDMIETGPISESERYLAGNNMLVAYGIQLSVLDELRASESFQRVKIRGVPEVVAAVTRDVCDTFDVDNYMNYF